MVTPKRIDVILLEISGSERIHEGQIIRQRFNALPFVRVDWETEVTDIVYYERFTLRQRKGPYSHWLHNHHIRSVAGGVELTDTLQYGLPFGLLGRVANTMLVRGELDGVFNYRANALQEYFGVQGAVIVTKLQVQEVPAAKASWN